MTKPLSTRDIFQLKFAADDLQEKIVRGGYLEDDLVTLRRLLSSVVNDFGLQPREIESYGSVSRAVIRGVLGGGHPKLHNFYALLNSVKIIIRHELIERNVLNSNSFFDSEDDWMRPSAYTQKGMVLNAALTLEHFIDKFKQRNDIGEFFSEKQREDLIDIIEAIVIQLKGSVIKIGLIRRITAQLALMGKNFGGKFADKSVSEAAGKAVEALEKLL